VGLDATAGEKFTNYGEFSWHYTQMRRGATPKSPRIRYQAAGTGATSNRANALIISA